MSRKLRTHKAELPYNFIADGLDAPFNLWDNRVATECGRWIERDRTRKRWSPSIDCVQCKWRHEGE